MNRLFGKLKKDETTEGDEDISTGPSKIKRKKLKVMVYGNGGPQQSSIIISTGGSYSGFLYDLWSWIAKDMDVKIEYKTIEGREKNKDGVTYNEAVDLFRKSDFDVLIGDFSVTKNREEKIDFTRSVMLEKPIILYRREDTPMFSAAKEAVKKFAMPFLYLIILGLLLGLLLYKVDPKARSLPWALFGTISSLLGESGTVVEKTDPKKLKSSLWAILILVTAFYFNIYLSAKATAAEIAQKDDMDPFKSGIKGEFVAASQNSAFSELLKSQGAVVAPITKKNASSMSEKIEYWLEKQPHVLGFITKETTYRMGEAGRYNLNVSNYRFGFDQIAFIVHQNKKDILFRVNTSLIKAQNNKVARDLCSQYYAGEYLKFCRI